MLHSIQEMTDCIIGATDGEIGHVTDFLFDDKSWVIRYMVVETGSRLLSRKVLVSPDWVKHIDWDTSKVTLDLLQQTVKDSPRFESGTALNRIQEASLHQHHERPTYWEKEQRLDESTAAQD